MISVFGHLNPDSDTICSALVTADWLNALGKPAQAFRLGELTPETLYILKQANRAAPPLLVEDLTDKPVWLVDFTEFEQGPVSLPASNILGIIDHHRLGTVMTKNPPDIWVRAVGCCGTIIWQIMTRECEMAVKPSQATLLLGAILSDTVGLTSPTTTAQDQQAVKALLAINGLNYQDFLDGLLAAKTDISGKTAAELLQKDAKNYTINGVSLLLAQIEVSAFAAVTPLVPQLLEEIERERQARGLDIVVLILTDISLRNSTLYFSHNAILPQGACSLPGAISRKKEILPYITDLLTKAH